MASLAHFPRYSHGEPPQPVASVQQPIGIVLPQRFGAVVLAPQPATQAVPHPVLCFAEYARALPVMEVPTPAPQQLVQFANCFGYVPMQCPVVQLAADLLPQPLLALGARLDMRIPVPALVRTLPAYAETQEVEPLPAVHHPGFLFVELEPSPFQPFTQSLHQCSPLSRGAKDDEVIRITHHNGSSGFFGVVDSPVQLVEV